MTRRGRKPVHDELTGDLFASLPETEGEPDVVLPTDVAGMLALLARWHEEGWLRRIDLELAHFLAEGAEPSPALPPVLLAAALCSWQLGRGHVCLDLQAVLEQPMPVLSIPVEPWLQTLTLADWQAACVACPRRGPGQRRWCWCSIACTCGVSGSTSRTSSKASGSG